MAPSAAELLRYQTGTIEDDIILICSLGSLTHLNQALLIIDVDVAVVIPRQSSNRTN